MVFTRKIAKCGTVLGRYASMLGKRLRDIDVQLFDSALHKHKRKRKDDSSSQDNRQLKWQRLEAMARGNMAPASDMLPGSGATHAVSSLESPPCVNSSIRGVLRAPAYLRGCSSHRSLMFRTFLVRISGLSQARLRSRLSASLAVVKLGAQRSATARPPCRRTAQRPGRCCFAGNQCFRMTSQCCGAFGRTARMCG